MKELLHAINMRYVTLIPRSDREIALLTKEDLKPRKADLKSQLITMPKFNPDAEESNTDDEEGETSKIIGEQSIFYVREPVGHFRWILVDCRS